MLGAYGAFPPTLTLPHKGGGNASETLAISSPPPLWGRVRVGGPPQSGANIHRTDHAHGR
jgi:hypothetical protein